MKKHIRGNRFNVLFLLVFLLSLGFASVAGAEPVKEEGALTTKPPEEMNDNQMLAAYKYLSVYSSDIASAGGGMGSVFGTTGAISVADFVGIDAAIQRWTGEQWVGVTSKTASKNASKSVSLNENFAVTSGYYYRVVSTHTVRMGSELEKTTYTSPSHLMK
ncbi:hypothetical protein [Paenibacillus sp. Marseille-Q4541]|uniref:hypothetical protein n=1 Tax=Paenibacillus sp. Marseille-Q4541 TaxID=2831522 RepID=UPI001BAA1518|nr:hypothetical protein [Paenibacillus sp. Marseille-Q4541]